MGEWNDNEDVPYASAFDDDDVPDVEDPNSHYDDTEQEEPKKKPARSRKNSKKKSLLGDEEVVHGKPVCCTPVVIGASTFLILILICAAVISGFIISDEIEKANALTTPCTNKQTGDTCIMDADNGAEGICKLDDSKFINDGELICDDVTLYEEACYQKNSDDTCVVKDYSPGKCMYLSTTTKVLWCNIPSYAELACLVRTRSQKSQEVRVSSQSVKILRRAHARWLSTAGGNSASCPIRMKRFVQAWAKRILAQRVLA